MGRKNGSPSEPILVRRRIETGSSCVRGLENAVDGAVDGADGPEVYPLPTDLRLGEECPEIIELRSEIGRGCSCPSLLTTSLSEATGGETGCFRKSHLDIVAVLV